MKLKVHIETPFAGCNIDEEIEIDPADLEGKDENWIECYCDEIAQDTLFNKISYGYELVEDDE